MLKLKERTQRPENADFPLKSQEEELGVVRALIFSYFASRRQIAKWQLSATLRPGILRPSQKCCSFLMFLGKITLL